MKKYVKRRNLHEKGGAIFGASAVDDDGCKEDRTPRF